RVTRMADRPRTYRGPLGRCGASRPARGDPPVTRGIGLYVHIPFCASRCPYCDFATAPATSALRGRYLAALAEEMLREGRAHGLRALGRTHQPEDSAAAVAAARDAGFDVNLDLIFGWPGQREDDWREDLRSAIALAPDHASCYPLELRLDPKEAVANWPGGGWRVLERWRRDALDGQPDERVVAGMYRQAERQLGMAGYRHYEIANWARPGKRSLHNLGYWRDREWLGVGAGAHSHIAGVRSANPAELGRYLARVASGAERAIDAGADAPVEAAMLALRLDSGLDLGRYTRRFGSAAGSRVRSALAEVGPAGLVRVSRDVARLTPRGRLLASEVFVRLLA